MFMTTADDESNRRRLWLHCRVQRRMGKLAAVAVWRRGSGVTGCHTIDAHPRVPATLSEYGASRLAAMLDTSRPLAAATSAGLSLFLLWVSGGCAGHGSVGGAEPLASVAAAKQDPGGQPASNDGGGARQDPSLATGAGSG